MKALVGPKPWWQRVGFIQSIGNLLSCTRNLHDNWDTTVPNTSLWSFDITSQSHPTIFPLKVSPTDKSTTVYFDFDYNTFLVNPNSGIVSHTTAYLEENTQYTVSVYVAKGLFDIDFRLVIESQGLASNVEYSGNVQSSASGSTATYDFQRVSHTFTIGSGKSANYSLKILGDGSASAFYSGTIVIAFPAIHKGANAKKWSDICITSLSFDALTFFYNSLRSRVSEGYGSVGYSLQVLKDSLFKSNRTDAKIVYVPGASIRESNYVDTNDMTSSQWLNQNVVTVTNLGTNGVPDNLTAFKLTYSSESTTRLVDVHQRVPPAGTIIKMSMYIKKENSERGRLYTYVVGPQTTVFNISWEYDSDDIVTITNSPAGSTNIVEPVPGFPGWSHVTMYNPMPSGTITNWNTQLYPSYDTPAINKSTTFAGITLTDNLSQPELERLDGTASYVSHKALPIIPSDNSADLTISRTSESLKRVFDAENQKDRWKHILEEEPRFEYTGIKNLVQNNSTFSDIGGSDHRVSPLGGMTLGDISNVTDEDGKPFLRYEFTQGTTGHSFRLNDIDFQEDQDYSIGLFVKGNSSAVSDLTLEIDQGDDTAPRKEAAFTTSFVKHTFYDEYYNRTSPNFIDFNFKNGVNGVTYVVEIKALGMFLGSDWFEDYNDGVDYDLYEKPLGHLIHRQTTTYTSNSAFDGAVSGTNDAMTLPTSGSFWFKNNGDNLNLTVTPNKYIDGANSLYIDAEAARLWMADSFEADTGEVHTMAMWAVFDDSGHSINNYLSTNSGVNLTRQWYIDGIAANGVDIPLPGLHLVHLVATANADGLTVDFRAGVGVNSTRTCALEIIHLLKTNISYPPQVPILTGSGVSSKTLLADLVRNDGLVGKTPKTEGYAFADFEVPVGASGNSKYILSLNDGTVSNRIIIYINGSDKIEGTLIQGGTQIFSAQTPAAVIERRKRVCFKFNGTTAKLFVNGSLVDTDANTFNGYELEPRQLDVGHRVTGTNVINSRIISVSVDNREITDSEAIAMTSFGEFVANDALDRYVLFQNRVLLNRGTMYGDQTTTVNIIDGI